jgi:predicted nucleic acid-binding protein
MLVADANLVAALVLEQPGSSMAAAVWEKDPVWCAPVLWASELRSILGKYVRKGLLTRGGAEAALQLARRVIPEKQTLEPSDRDVLALAHKSGCSTYDCEYVDCAIALGVPLVTFDAQVLAAFPGTATSPDRFVALPSGG